MSYKESIKELNSKRVEAVIAYIKRHVENPFCCKLNLEALAKSVYLSHYHLSRIFKSHTGETIHQYIKRQRLENAARLLNDDTHTIQVIARLSAYNTVPAFTKAFKQLYGCSPSEYRASLKSTDVS